MDFTNDFKQAFDTFKDINGNISINNVKTILSSINVHINDELESTIISVGDKDGNINFDTFIKFIDNYINGMSDNEAINILKGYDNPGKLLSDIMHYGEKFDDDEIGELMVRIMKSDEKFDFNGF